MMNLTIFAALAAVAAPTAPDTLVVCPTEFRAALAPWEQLRRAQGHQLAFVTPPQNVDSLRAAIRRAAAAGRLRSVLLIGDVPDAQQHQQTGHDRTRSSAARRSPRTIPIDYVDARVNIRWGSEATIATDQSLADLDGDHLPDLAVGRIPADTPDELAGVVRKIMRYEHEADHGLWRRRVDVVAGIGGFGVLADTLIEGAARSVFEQTVPAGFVIRPTLASPTSRCCPPPGQFTPHVCRQLSAGSFAWIYLGHGLPTRLDEVDTPTGRRPILSTDDLPHVHCGAASPLAVLVACYTGAIDASADCLAEELLNREQGPVAVVAATRVSMPYGNAVFGYELLRACFRQRSATLGEVWIRAGRQTLADAAGDDPIRRSLDAVARGLSPPPLDLAAERHEHVLMYQLLGDPLLRLRLPHDLRLEAPPEATAGELLVVRGKCQMAGTCLVELVKIQAPGGGEVIAHASTRLADDSFRAELPLPKEAAGDYTVRAFVRGQAASAAGAGRVTVRQPQSPRTADASGIPAVRAK